MIECLRLFIHGAIRTDIDAFIADHTSGLHMDSVFVLVSGMARCSGLYAVSCKPDRN